MSCIPRQSIPKGTEILKLDRPMVMGTANGATTVTEYCNIKDVYFPEFSYSHKCDTIKCHILDRDVGGRWMILGCDFMSKFGIQLDFKHSTIRWNNKTIDIHPIGYFYYENFATIRKIKDGFKKSAVGKGLLRKGTSENGSTGDAKTPAKNSRKDALLLFWESNMYSDPHFFSLICMSVSICVLFFLNLMPNSYPSDYV